MLLDINMINAYIYSHQLSNPTVRYLQPKHILVCHFLIKKKKEQKNLYKMIKGMYLSVFH